MSGNIDLNQSCWVLLHSYEDEHDCDETKLIGVYSSKIKAEEALARTKLLIGFKDYDDSFAIDRYDLDQDNWSEGFINQ